MRYERRFAAPAVAAIAVLGFTGLTGCENTQGTSPKVDMTASSMYPKNDNQNNGAGGGTVEKPASSGGDQWTDPNPTRGGTRNPYGTGKTESGRDGSS